MKLTLEIGVRLARLQDDQFLILQSCKPDTNFREELTPLYAACFNSNIPISIIEFLLENKANPNNFITLSMRPMTILQDLRMNKEAFPVDRILKIEELFRKYGAKN